MIEVETNATILLGLALPDGTANKFPRAVIRDGVGTEQTGAPINSPVDLLHVADGKYQATTTALATAAPLSVLYITYDDAGHTVKSTKFGVKDEDLRIVDPIADQVWDELKAGHVTAGSFGEAVTAAAGHAGLHAVLDNVAHNANNSLTAARLRVFGNKAAADAATLGAADDDNGEILRLKVDSAGYSGVSAAVALEVLSNLRRTSS